MLFNFFYLSIIFGIASANPVAIPSQSYSEISDYSTDLVVQENPIPLFLPNVGTVTEFQKSELSTAVDAIYWVGSNVSYIITAAMISFCRLSNLCMGLEEYLPIVTDIVTKTFTPENLETAERVLVTVMGKYFEERSDWGLVLS